MNVITIMPMAPTSMNGFLTRRRSDNRPAKISATASKAQIQLLIPLDCARVNP
jgi:hypothetical protein